MQRGISFHEIEVQGKVLTLGFMTIAYEPLCIKGRGRGELQCKCTLALLISQLSPRAAVVAFPICGEVMLLFPTKQQCCAHCNVRAVLMKVD